MSSFKHGTIQGIKTIKACSEDIHLIQIPFHYDVVPPNSKTQIYDFKIGKAHKYDLIQVPNRMNSQSNIYFKYFIHDEMQAKAFPVKRQCYIFKP